MMSRFVFALLVALLSSTFAAQGQTQKVVTIRTNETFARGLQVSVPGLTLPLAGSFSLEMRRSVGASAAHTFSTAIGNLRVTATDAVNHKISLALLMSQQDAATLSDNYIGDLLYTEGSTTTNLGRLVFMVVQGVTPAPPATPPDYSDLAAWGPIADIYGGSDPTIAATLRGLTGPQGPQGPAGPTGPQGPAWTGPVTGPQLSPGAAVFNLGFAPLNPTNDLSDLINPATARANLGLPASSTIDATKALGVLASQIATTTFPSAYNSFTTSGYASAGDKGAGCVFKRVASTYPAAQMSLDGAYWGLAHDNGAVDVGCFGADSTLTDNFAQINAAATFASQSYSGSVNIEGNNTNGYFGAVKFGDKNGYKFSSPLTIPHNQTWDGCATGVAYLAYTGASGNALTLSGNESAINCMHMTSTTASVLTDVTGVQIGTGTDLFESARLRDFHSSWYDTAINIKSGILYNINNVVVDGYGSFGAVINDFQNFDGGDGTITGSTFSIGGAPGTHVAGVSYQSGGGLKFLDNKILGGERGFDLYAGTFGAGGTVDLMFLGNSVENQNIDCMRLIASDVPAAPIVRWSSIAITGNEFGGCPTAIRFGGGVWNAHVAANVIQTTTYGIVIQNNSNHITGDLGNVNSNVAIPFVDQRNDYYESGWFDRSMTREIRGITSSSVYTKFWDIKVDTQYRGAKIYLYFEGEVAGVGSFTRDEVFDVRTNGTTMVYTNTTSAPRGAAIDVNFDYTTTPGVMTIELRRNNAGGGTALNGTVTMHIDGKTTQINQY